MYAVAIIHRTIFSDNIGAHGCHLLQETIIPNIAQNPLATIFCRILNVFIRIICYYDVFLSGNANFGIKQVHTTYVLKLTNHKYNIYYYYGCVIITK